MKTNFNLQKLISEELNGLINESYIMEHENFKFRQEIKNSSSFYNYDELSQDYDVDIDEGDITVNWHISFWLNDFGIENFIVTIDSVEGTYHVLLIDKQSNEIERDYNKNIEEIQWEFEIDDAELHMGKVFTLNR